VDWQQLAAEWLSKGLRIALILILAYAGIRLVRIAARAVGKAMDGEGRLRFAARQQRVATVTRLVKRTGTIIIFIVAMLTILAELKVSVTPLLASAGIVGVALGLGTQSLVKDVLAGFFILLEDQFAISDLVTIAGITGTVEQMSLRKTNVRDFNGTLYVVPNSEIRVVSNISKDWSRLIVDVGVAYDTDLTRAMSVLGEVSKQLVSVPEFEANVLEPPDVMGVMSLDDSAITLRVAVKVKPGAQWALGRALRKAIKEGFEREGIEIPLPQQVVHVKQ
jgi:small conductance mechanosensitive channel